MNRVILHCDCNSFFASVETCLCPEFADVPMAVCGDPESRHGIILAKNELAKQYGVSTAETIWQARQKCPNLVLARSHMSEYKRYSAKVNEIYLSYTDQVEPFGIDESWLDVTGSCHLFGTGEQIANELRERVKNELGITISVGVSYNKVFAKLGSDYKKPNATTVITPQNVREIVYPLPVGDLLYVGRSAVKSLDYLGIHTIGQLAQTDVQAVAARLGKMGVQIWEYANGRDESPVARWDEKHAPKSIGNGMTFRRNLVGKTDVAAGVTALADEVAARMRKNGVKCSTVQVIIRSPDFQNISRQRTLDTPTNLARTLYEVSMRLIEENWNLSAPIRMITITGANLTEETAAQLSLFRPNDDERSSKLEKLERAVDGVRQKFGNSAVTFGRVYGNSIGVETDEDQEKPTFSKGGI